MRIRGVASVNSDDRDCFFSLLEVAFFFFFFLAQENASTSHKDRGIADFGSRY